MMMAASSSPLGSDGLGGPANNNNNGSFEVNLVGSTYYYREVQVPYRHHGTMETLYRLEAVLPFRTTLRYDQRKANWTLSNDEQNHLRLFGRMVISEVNTTALRFVFASRDKGAYVCRVTPSFQLSVTEYHAVPPAYEAAEARRPPDNDLNGRCAASTYTLLHSFVESERNSTGIQFQYKGMMLFPSGTLFLPVWMGNQGMGTLLQELRMDWIPKAEIDMHLLMQTRDMCWIRYLNPTPIQPDASMLLPAALASQMGGATPPPSSTKAGGSRPRPLLHPPPHGNHNNNKTRKDNMNRKRHQQLLGPLLRFSRVASSVVQEPSSPHHGCDDNTYADTQQQRDADKKDPVEGDSRRCKVVFPPPKRPTPPSV